MRELRRWLHLGQDGVLIAIRDAQPSGLRPLARLLAEIEPERSLLVDAHALLDLEPNALALLVLRQRDLGWLNLNRPLFAQRRLRVVLWVEPALSGPFKFESPDLHDWVSHFVPCPPGVPEFAVEGLRVGASWWPGVAWRGPGLDLALAELGIETRTLDPMAPFEGLVEALSGERDSAIRWVGVDSVRALWHVRWAVAEARHWGLGVLDNPGVPAPGWFPVDARQLDIVGASLIRSLELAVSVEFEEAALPPHTLQSSDLELNEEQQRELGLLLRAGPQLRRMHGSPLIQAWRRGCVRRMRGDLELPWTWTEMALFASLERDRRQWPNWSRGAAMYFQNEHELRMLSPADRPYSLGIPAAQLSDTELVRRWGLPGDVKSADLQLMMSQLVAPPAGDHWEDISAAAVVRLGNSSGWHTPHIVRATARATLASIHEPASEGLEPQLREALESARGDLGKDHPNVLELEWIAAMATALTRSPWDAREHLLTLVEEQTAPLPAHLGLELAAICVLSGAYSQASAILDKRELTANSPALRLQITALRAAGEHEGAKATLEVAMGPGASADELLGGMPNAQEFAREFLLERLATR